MRHARCISAEPYLGEARCAPNSSLPLNRSKGSTMFRFHMFPCALVVSLGVIDVSNACAQQAQPGQPGTGSPAPGTTSTPVTTGQSTAAPTGDPNQPDAAAAAGQQRGIGPDGLPTGNQPVTDQGGNAMVEPQ